MDHHLLGLYDSPYVRRVAITMKHHGIPFTHESLSVFRHIDAMRPQNPLLRVPQLTTPDGAKLHESGFILDYLDEVARLAGRVALAPAAGALRRQVWQATGLAQAAADKAVAIAYEFRRPESLRWAEWLDRLREQLRTAFGLLEDQLTFMRNSAPVMMKHAKGELKARPPHPLRGPRLALHSQPAAAARRMRREFPPRPSRGATGKLASLDYHQSLRTRCFTLSGEWLVGDRMSHADIMTAVGVGFVRHVIPAEWPEGQFQRIEALSARLESTPAFRAVPINEV